MWKKARALIQKPTFVEKLIAFIASSPLLIFLLLSLLRKNVQTPMQFSRLSRRRAFLRQVNRAKIRQRGAPPPPVSRGKILSNRENHSVRTARERNKNIPFFFLFFFFCPRNVSASGLLRRERKSSRVLCEHLHRALTFPPLFCRRIKPTTHLCDLKRGVSFLTGAYPSR